IESSGPARSARCCPHARSRRDHPSAYDPRSPRETDRGQHMRHRSGSTALEALVAFTLLSAALTFATPLVVQHSRLLKAQRDYRLALREVYNQIARLSLLPTDELSGALSQLTPSELIAAKLPGAELRGRLDDSDLGRRLTLRLSWQAQSSPTTISLTTWVLPASHGRAQP